MTQQEAAAALGVSRPLLASMEKGTRAPRPDELIRLAGIYEQTIDEMLRPSPPFEALGVQLRTAVAHTPDKETLSELVREVEKLGDDYLDLGRRSGVELPRRYPAPRDVGNVAPRQAAEDLATEERNRLGLGDAPIPQLRDVLEDEVGLRIFGRSMPSRIAGLFTYAEPLGGCIVLNAKHPPERRRWTLAHEYAHFLVRRTRTEVTYLGGWERVPATERLADAFAENFLMPRSGLSRRYHELSRARKDDITPADLLQLAHVFRVSVQALTLRLEDLGLAPSGTYDNLLDQGFRPRDAERLLGLEREVPDPAQLPLRYRLLAVTLYISGEITEGQLARYLRTDRVTARRAVADLRASEDVADDGSLRAWDLRDEMVG